MRKVDIISGRRIVLLFAAIISGFILTGQIFAQAEITAFNFNLNPTYAETIDPATQVIDVDIYNSANKTSLVAVFTVSANATVKIGSVVQTSGQTSNDFSNQVIFTVTSEDGTVTKEWKVNVEQRAAINDKELISFEFAAITGAVGVIDQGAHTVAVTVPYSQDVTALVATFTLSPLASAKVGTVTQISATTANDYTSTLTFTVVAENGSTRNYYVTITRAAAKTDKQLISFDFKGLDPDVIGVIDQGAFTVTLTVPYEADETALVATFTSSYLSTIKVGTVVQTSGSTANDFTSPVTYTVVAEDGSTQAYTVTVNKAAASSAKQITLFNFTNLDPDAVGVINEVNHTIALVIPFSADITDLIASFTVSPFAVVKIGTTVQVSGTTSNDFTSDVVYIVTAQDASTQNYTVTVTQLPASQSNDMLTFDFKAATNAALDTDVVGVIDNGAKTIALVVPYGTPVSSLVPTFTNSPLSTVSVNTVVQVSGITPQNFTAAVSYTVTAEDGSTEIYTVTVSHTNASQGNTLLTFKFVLSDTDYDGVIDEGAKTVSVHVPFATDLSTLVATFTVSDFAHAKVGTVTQQTGVTANNFTNAVVYSIVAQDGSTELYTVTVTIDSNSNKKFTSFSFQGLTPNVVGTINEDNHTIVAQVPSSVDRSALVASFVVSTNATVKIGTVTQVSGTTPNDFTVVITYTVIADDASTQDYQVTVTNLAIQTSKEITSFIFAAFDPDVVGSINQTNHTIDATLPIGESVTALVANFTNSYLSAVTVGGVDQVSGVTANDFTSPVTYLVTAEDGSTQTYLVTVTVTQPSSEKELTYFAFEDLNPDVVGVIDQNSQTVSLTVENGTDRTALRAFFTTSPFTEVRIPGGGGVQISGITVIDFTNPVVYEVYAQDGTMKAYVVTVFEKDDVTPPEVKVITTDGTNTNLNQVTNELGQFVLLQSNEASGKVYIIEEDAPQSTVVELEASVAAGKGKTVWVQLANTNIPISTHAMDEGTYYAYAIDAASNMSDKSTVAITIDDELAPTIIITAQTISNAPSNSVVGQSTEDNGFIYLIKDDVPQTTKGQLDAAVSAKNGVKGYVFAALTDITLPVAGLNPGDYHGYAVDDNSNLSDASSQIVVITAASRLKSMTSFSFQGTTPASIGHIAGTLIDIEVPYGTSVTDLVASFTISEKANAYIGLVEQVSGVTANDFTDPVTYTVEAEDGTTLDYVMTVTIASGTGIDEIQWLEAISIYPNPVQDQLSIEMLKPVDRVVVIDLLGQVVADIDKPGTDLIQISSQSWTPGLFIVRFFRQGETVYHSELIKQ